jgi:hypothetical protein
MLLATIASKIVIKHSQTTVNNKRPQEHTNIKDITKDVILDNKIQLLGLLPHVAASILAIAKILNSQ